MVTKKKEEKEVSGQKGADEMPVGARALYEAGERRKKATLRKKKGYRG